MPPMGWTGSHATPVVTVDGLPVTLDGVVAEVNGEPADFARVLALHDGKQVTGNKVPVAKAGSVVNVTCEV